MWCLYSSAAWSWGLPQWRAIDIWRHMCLEYSVLRSQGHAHRDTFPCRWLEIYCALIQSGGLQAIQRKSMHRRPLHLASQASYTWDLGGNSNSAQSWDLLCYSKSTRPLYQSWAPASAIGTVKFQAVDKCQYGHPAIHRLVALDGNWNDILRLNVRRYRLWSALLSWMTVLHHCAPLSHEFHMPVG